MKIVTTAFLLVLPVFAGAFCPAIPDNGGYKLDAVLSTPDGTTYAFSGQQWMAVNKTHMITPRPMSYWNGLPANVDAGVYLAGFIFFFKDDQSYAFNLDKSEYWDNPVPMATILPGLPTHLDAVFVWKRRVYFVKGGMYYLRTKTGVSGPRPLRNLIACAPAKVDAAFVSSDDGKLYLFSGRNYYTVDDKTSRVVFVYPNYWYYF